jgi:hypothetical protein
VRSPSDADDSIERQEYGEWKSRLEKSADLLKNRHRTEWRENTGALETRPLADKPDRDLVVVNKDLPRVKQKIAQLFYQVPEVQLKPRRDDYACGGTGLSAGPELLPDQASQDARDDARGPERCARRLWHRDQQARLRVRHRAWSRCRSRPCRPPGQPPSAAETAGQLAAPTAPGHAAADGRAPDPLASLGAPLRPAGPRCIYENYFWNRISPAKFVFPEEFIGSDFDEAPWLGFEFRINVEEAKRKYNLPPDFRAAVLTTTSSRRPARTSRRRTHQHGTRLGNLVQGQPLRSDGPSTRCSSASWSSLRATTSQCVTKIRRTRSSITSRASS